MRLNGIHYDVGITTVDDLAGIDAYRDASNRDGYAAGLRTHLASDRPVVATEVGCATYRGAPDAGGMGWAVVERTPEPRLRDGVVRDEAAQASEVGELLEVMESCGGLDSAATFDTASFALVRGWPDGRTEPKAAYHAVAERYGTS